MQKTKGGGDMKTKSGLYLAGAVIAVLLAACAAQTGSGGVGSSDLGGVVNGPKGPEAGVWVIAETTDLPTKFAKIVVTDASGRYLMPDLPKANYSVWVRGYGLVDSPKVRATPGTTLNLTAVPAPSAKAAAEYYPAIYWYSMLKIPQENEFPVGKVKTQVEWLSVVKTNGCNGCHAMGTPGTRTIPKDFTHMSSVDAWTQRIQSGQALPQMARDINRLDAPRALALFADWTDRVAAGELPFAQPQRPQGVERNIVLTLWDWASTTTYLHDLIGTDRRKPTVNANGKLYGSAEESTDMVPVLDPNTHTVSEVKHPVRDPKTPSSKSGPMQPSAYWGPKPIWDSQTSNHNPMMDEKGRPWFAARVRHPSNPDFCKKGSSHPSAKVFPINDSGRHLSMYDPASGKWTLISTCFPTHHLIFAEDANNTVWVSSAFGPGVIGWLNRKVFEETGDEARAQGWTPLILDTNGNGKRDAYVEHDQPVDPAKDKRLNLNIYAVAVNPVDGSVWGTAWWSPVPGAIIRLNPGSNPTETALAEVYEPPMPGYGPRGGDIDRNGIYWVSLASGHLGKFDRSKCKVLNGPKATGKHCPEGWTLYPFPGPQFRDVKSTGSAEASYYVWVDQFNTLGLGANVPIATGNLNDAYLALVDGKFVSLRVPYPMGFFPKWGEGRIDNPNAGWKGRSMWSTTSTRTPFHNEGGKESKPRVIRFQLRPDPLAR
jgi:hypothetical protein